MNKIKKFYENCIFDEEIDNEKWNDYDPFHYLVENRGKIVAVLSIIKRKITSENLLTQEGSVKRADIVEEIDHIWLCGVHEDHRKQGHFSSLIKLFKEDCTETVSVATYPEKWPDMYAWILKKKGKLISKSDGKCVFAILKENL